jgi:hypothetical protein
LVHALGVLTNLWLCLFVRLVLARIAGIDSPEVAFAAGFDDEMLTIVHMPPLIVRT